MKLKIFCLMFVVALILSACGAPALPLTGDVWTVQSGTTLYWIEQALLGKPGTEILQNGKDFLFVFPVYEKGYGFTMINNASNGVRAVKDWVSVTGGKGNLVNYPTLDNFLNYMKEKGWQTVPAAQVAKEISYSILSALKTISVSLWSIYVLPIGVLPDMDCSPGLNSCSDWQ